VAVDRPTRLARILTGYSTSVRRGDVVLIECSGPASRHLLRAVHRECLRRGAAHVEYRVELPELTRDFFTEADERQLASFPAHRLDFLREVDVTIGIRADENSMEMAGVPRDRIMTRTRVLRPLVEERVNNTRWVVTRIPTAAMAQEAGFSLDELEDLYYAACLRDWKRESARQDGLVRVLGRARRVRITGPGTDLTLDVEGMPVNKADGHRNMPDGEVFTVPRTTSARGMITFNIPACYGGARLSGIRLEFEGGRVVAADADAGRDDLAAILDTDPGARYLGEFAFGLNAGIRRPVGNILFDEKIAGSIHLALGNAYGSCSNGNESAIHWDLVRLMNDGGRIEFDGRVVQDNGLFVLPGLRDLNPPA
jgi:aminopeptidase